MADLAPVLVLSLLIAFLVRIFWRAIVNLIVIGGISVIVVIIFLVVIGLDQVAGVI